jgi:hypothetical protein
MVITWRVMQAADSALILGDESNGASVPDYTLQVVSWLFVDLEHLDPPTQTIHKRST